MMCMCMYPPTNIVLGSYICQYGYNFKVWHSIVLYYTPGQVSPLQIWFQIEYGRGFLGYLGI